MTAITKIRLRADHSHRPMCQQTAALRDFDPFRVQTR
jgi:hypothetical protein